MSGTDQAYVATRPQPSPASQSGCAARSNAFLPHIVLRSRFPFDFAVLLGTNTCYRGTALLGDVRVASRSDRPIGLRACYALSGTNLAYGLQCRLGRIRRGSTILSAYARATQRPVLADRMVLCEQSAISLRALGTDLAYCATRSIRNGVWCAPLSTYAHAMRCPAKVRESEQAAYKVVPSSVRAMRCPAMSGTDIAQAALISYAFSTRCLVLTSPVVLRLCYALSGTSTRATHPLCNVRYWHCACCYKMSGTDPAYDATKAAEDCNYLVLAPLSAYARAMRCPAVIDAVECNVATRFQLPMPLLYRAKTSVLVSYPPICFLLYHTMTLLYCATLYTGLGL
eukprot:2465887-Rhodomonas_salina.1